MRRLLADPRLGARVLGRRPLRYRHGADSETDRPAHVRSTSALVLVGDRLLAVQDDANFLAFVDPQTGEAEALPMRAGPDGARLFDDHRGNKRHKLDLEAAVALEGGAALLFGSGSKAAREVVVHVQPGGRHRIFQAPSFYERLGKERRFAGSELNVEGAVRLGDRLRLFNRGNGAPRDERPPINGTVELDLPALLRHLHGDGPPPELWAPTPFDLGHIDGVPLTFTDAAATRSSILYSAAAEASPNAVDDGPIAGVALGWYGDLDGRWCLLRDERGSPSQDKVEAVLPQADGTLLLAIDQDDPFAEAELLVAELTGPWPPFAYP